MLERPPPGSIFSGDLVYVLVSNARMLCLTILMY